MSIEAQLGKTFSLGFGAYLDGLVGVGGDRDYDWDVGAELRFKYC